MEFTSTEGERRYAELVRTASRAVVGLDFDGTLSPIVDDPERLKRAAKMLALDLGVERTALAVDPMRRDRLTLILTDPLG